MELYEKLQKLRKERGLTQDQLAEVLFVSRTAVSKWETGRGVPSMDSLQMLSKFYEITLDELLRAEEVVAVAKRENKENLSRFAACIDGIFNAVALLGLLLPLYKTKVGDVFYSVPLYQFQGKLSLLFWTLTVLLSACGITQIFLRQWRWQRYLRILGFGLNAASTALLILCGQPYPAVLFFTLLLFKGTVMVIKQQ